MEKDPFASLKISDPKFLDEIAERTECPKCGKTRKYYCYACYVPMTCIQDQVPRIKLPIKIDVIKHPSEVDGKSTAVHAGVLAPDNVTIYTYPVIPNYDDPSRVILIFPGDNSVTLEELAGVQETHSATEGDPKPEAESSTETKKDTETDEGKSSENLSKETPAQDSSAGDAAKRSHSEEDGEEPATKKSHVVPECPYDHVVFIDSTWNQTMKIYKDERLRGLKQVELKTRKTRFWRYQKDKPNTYLATIEAIYYFVVDHHNIFMGTPDSGRYDDLLFFFSYMYRKIRNLYDGGDKLRAYRESKTKEST